jgi:hypothetical protein
MEMNKIVLAPSTDEAADLFTVWQQTHVGTMADFYAFLTTPSTRRAAFMATVNRSHTAVSTFITYTLTPTP